MELITLEYVTYNATYPILLTRIDIISKGTGYITRGNLLNYRSFKQAEKKYEVTKHLYGIIDKIEISPMKLRTEAQAKITPLIILLS